MKLMGYLTIILLAGWLIFTIGCAKQDTTPVETTEERVRVACSFCGMEMFQTAMGASMDYEGQTLYFCTENEMEEFMKNPEGHLTGELQGEMM